MKPVVSIAALAATSLLALSAVVAAQQQVEVDINKISSGGVGEKVGTVTVSEQSAGVKFQVSVKGLPSGQRGFHVHEKGDCGPGLKDGQMQAGIAAGDHFDPEGHKSHKGPQGKGHKGDLPLLQSNVETINQAVTAPRLKLADVRGRSLMIHEGGDNYSDQPENGGGKGRVACGVVPK